MLNVNSLKNDILSVLENMKNDQDFADGISNAVKKFVESGTVTTVDAGAVSAGTFTGTGNGSISCDAGICSSSIMNVCTAMKDMATGGDFLLASQISVGINLMISSGEVNCDVNGTVVPPSGSASMLSGKSKGLFTGVHLPMQTTFDSAFKTMSGMTEGGDDYMAIQMATAINAFLLAGAITTTGEGSLMGSVGMGKIS